MTSMRPWTGRGVGFTLVELLVVISVIALLMGILMPVLQTAAAKAKETKCLSNLFQLGKSIVTYGVNYRYYLPSPAHPEAADTVDKFNDKALYDDGLDAVGNKTYSWRGKLIPFLGTVSEVEDELYAVLKCPSVRDFKGRHSFYGMNAYAALFTKPLKARDDTNLFRYVLLEDFDNPAGTFLIGENNTGHWAVKPLVPRDPADFTGTEGTLTDDAKSHARHAGT